MATKKKSPGANASSVDGVSGKLRSTHEMGALMKQFASAEQARTLAAELLESAEKLKTASVKMIRPFDLRELGYQLAGRMLCLPGDVRLMEVVDPDTGKRSSFSFLHSKSHGMGLVLPRSFDAMLNGSESQ